jgi:hypothetical protein
MHVPPVVRAIPVEASGKLYTLGGFLYRVTVFLRWLDSF